MKFEDYSPPAAPSLDQQRDALQKGLGRAVQWATSGRLDEDLLLEACLRDLRYDYLCEQPRGDWLWRIIEGLGAVHRFRVPILHALHALPASDCGDQLCQLAKHYAESGDEAFRSVLYEIVDRKPFPDSPWVGEKEIVALDGERGFLFAAVGRGRRLAECDWEWDDGSLVTTAVERFGETRVAEILESSADASVRRFYDAWRRDAERQASPARGRTWREEMVAMSVEGLLAASKQKNSLGILRGWGLHATDDNLRAFLPHLWAERDVEVMANLLCLLAGRALPEFDARLIELCRHGDAEVRRRALIALAQNSHPDVREFALHAISKGLRDGDVAALFVKNYQPGDEAGLLDAIEMPDAADERHWLLMDIRKVLQKNPESDASRLGLVCYAFTPCAHCRFGAVEPLMARKLAPEWLKEECRFDAEEDCRSAVASDLTTT